MRGIGEYDWNEIKNVTKDGAQKVKEKLGSSNGLSNMELGLLLGISLLLGIIIGFIWAPLKPGLVIAGHDVYTGMDEEQSKGEEA